MGCGASVAPGAQVTAFEATPEDPLQRLLAEVARLRGDLRRGQKELAESAQKWRYMRATLDKLAHVNEDLAVDLEVARDMHEALAYQIAEQDAQDLYAASAGFGTDEEKMGRVILGRLHENIVLTDKIYQQRYGRSLEDLVRGENKTLLGLLGADSMSHFGRFLTYRTMPQGKRDALIIRRCVSGFGCSDFILIEVLSTRTNDELRDAAEQYALEFDGEDMVERIKSETGGFGKKWYGKWVDTLVEFDRDESHAVPEDVEDLAKQLYDAGAGKWTGCDEQVFIDILCKANEETCMALVEAYDNLEKSKRTLIEDAEKELGGDLEFAVLARLRPRLDFFAHRLYKACKGWGTDEECICRVLGCLENGEVRRVAERYNELHGGEAAPFNEFRTMIRSELSGSLLDAVLNLLDSFPPKGHWDVAATYNPKASAEAEDFRTHVEDHFDEEKAMLLGGTDLNGPLKLLNVDTHFVNEGYDYHLACNHPHHQAVSTDHLMSSSPDDVQEAQQLVDALKVALRSTQQDTQRNNAACEGSKAMYYDLSRSMRFTDHKLHQISNDNTGMLEFCAQRDADAVHEAVEGWGTDEDRLIRILCSLSKAQLRRVDQIYAQRYGKSLRETTDSELGGTFEGNLKYFMKCAMTPPAELDAELLRESMAGWGTNDGLLCEICCTRTNKELREAKRIFAQGNGKSVEEWVEGDTSGFYTTFLLRCLQGNRREGFKDEDLASAQATQLHGAGLGGGDLDPAVLLEVLVPASEAQMQLIARKYKEWYGKDLAEAVKEMGGEMERALLARVYDKFTYQAIVLHRAFAGLGTDEKATSRVFGRNTKVDLRRIGARFEELFGGSLRQAVQREVSGDYQKALLTYLYAEGPGGAGAPHN